MRSPLPVTALVALLALLDGCAGSRVVPLAESSRSSDPLTGTVWWHRSNDGPRCLEWTFVSTGPDAVHLERREVEEEEGWSREVRTFYSIARESGRTVIYAPGYDYRWIREPGPDAHSFPGQRGAMGYVSGFCLLGDDGQRLEWAETSCDLPPAAESVQRWYRSAAACEASLGR